ncbi:ABC transporter ATP-binding protein [Leucobacter coleopterorum]|uniref:ABC transporter ATP-binding protein n=1 Tax=Leucobacter coleopterorum TaxID=2714933 RepID=UPI001FCB197E|nr:ABC transporter ATP-binding protein [Leucobacter coleopterorum]
MSKSFKIKHANSFKEAFVSKLRGEETTTQFQAVNHVSFEVPAGQSVAVMGRNGSGKSTTLKMISGVLRPDTGWIRIRGRVAGLLEVGAGFNPNLTGRENVYLNAAILGMSKEETDARFEDIHEFSELGEFIDTEVKQYSSGMYSRLGFSVAAHTEQDVLLVDEVLSVGDAAFRKKCTARMLEMRSHGKTMFIVSHSTSQVRQLCDRGIVLQQGKLVFDGPIEEAIEMHESSVSDSDRRLQRGSKRPFVAAESHERFMRNHPDAYGAPLGAPAVVEENGGGLIQECVTGLVVTSNELRVSQGLRNGAFQRAYAAAGGPAGEWGFLVGKIQVMDQEGLRALRFQNGTAYFRPETEEIDFVNETA